MSRFADKSTTSIAGVVLFLFCLRLRNRNDIVRDGEPNRRTMVGVKTLAAQQRPTIARRSWMALVAFLLLQNVIHSIFGEPYPAIRMPSFRVNGDSWDAIIVKHPEPVFIYEDGTRIVLNRSGLFSELRGEMSLTAINNLMQPGSTEKGDHGQPWIDAIIPGYQQAKRHSASRAPQLQALLLTKAKQLHPSSRPTRFVMRWQEALIKPGSLEVQSSSLKYEYEVSFQ